MNGGLSGLVNMGNTCYINAAIQCLSHTDLLRIYFLENKYKEDINYEKKEHKLCISFIDVLKALWEDNCIVKPISFMQQIGLIDKRFSGFNQHDSQEILSIIINTLHLSLSYQVNMNYKGNPKNEIDHLMIESIKLWKNNFKNEYSYILDTFYGQFHSKIKCEKCNKIINNYDPFSTINLPINNKCKTIYDCFDEFVKTEYIDTDNKWICDNCKKGSNIYKSMFLWKMPKILIVVFKRFNFNFIPIKINNIITFPIDNLNLSNYVNGYDKYNSKYNAYAIINHVGNMNNGHYYSYCKYFNNCWYEFNDESVSKINTIQLNNVYVIFYKQIE